MTTTTTKYGIVALVAILAMATVAIALSQPAVAAPANKTAFGASGVSAIPDYAGFVTIASGSIKTSSPSDLLVRHDQECTIHTGLNLDVDNEDVTSAVREEVRLRVTNSDGDVRYINPVPLGPEGTNDNSTHSSVGVTLCGRAYSIDTNILSTILELCVFTKTLNNGTAVCSEEDDIFLDTFIRTKSAHGWSWVVPNMGPGVHEVEVQAKLVNNLDAVGNESGKKGKATNKDTCDVGIECVDTILEVGKRSLIITEEKFSSAI